MLDDGECPEAVHFQFVNPVGIIERSGPLQERHWPEMKGHQCIQNIRRSEIEPRRIWLLRSRPRQSSYIGVSLIALMFKCASVATSSVFDVRTRLAALIGLQQMTLAISAAIRVARISRRASREQRDSLCGAAVVPQRA